jgi:GH24 family phage-related lysozyme (muramidase)
MGPVDAFQKQLRDTTTYLMGGAPAAVEAAMAKDTHEAVEVQKDTAKIVKEELVVQKDTATKSQRIIDMLKELDKNTIYSNHYLNKLVDLLTDISGQIHDIEEQLKGAREDSKQAAEEAEKDRESASDKPDATKSGGDKEDGDKKSKGNDGDGIGGFIKKALGIAGAVAALGVGLDVLWKMVQQGAFGKMGAAFADMGKVAMETTATAAKVSVATAKFLGGGESAAGKIVGKSLAKVVPKGALTRFGAKVLPGIGAVLDTASAADRFMQGDVAGGAIDTASALASFVPYVGTAAAVGLQAWQLKRDLTDKDQGGSGYEMGKGFKNFGEATGLSQPNVTGAPPSTEATPGTGGKPGSAGQPVTKAPVTGVTTVSTADVSPTMLKYIASKEGLRLNVYEDAGNLAIGYGHDFTTSEQLTGGVMIGGKKVPINFSDTKTPQLSQEQALQLFQQDLSSKYVPRAKIQLGEATWNKLNDGQKAAIVDNVYNAGALTTSQVKSIKEGVASGNMQQAAQALGQGVATVHGKPSSALASRRENESELFAASSAPQATPVPSMPSQGAQLAQAGAGGGGVAVVNTTTVNNVTSSSGGGGGGGGSVLMGGKYNARDVHGMT